MKIDLSKKNLTAFKLFDNVEITGFNCSENQIILLPNEIGNLINLIELYCYNNQI